MGKKTEFSLAAMVAAVCAETWGSRASFERDVVTDLHRSYGAPAAGYLLPADAFRDLTAASASGGGYLTETYRGSYIATLQPASRVLQLGATPVRMGAGSTVLPRGVAGVSVTWSTTEASTTTESQPTFGSISFTRHEVSAFVEISRQLLLQSDAEQVIRTELRNALAAECDKQWIAGDNTSGKPLGIINVPGIGAITGTSLSYGALMDGEQAVSDANGVNNADALGFLTTPAVARLLKGRYINTNQTPVWSGPIAKGSIDGATAYSSKNVPAATLLFADWSQVLVAEWADGLSITIDPYTKMQQGIVGVRAIMSTDIALSNAGVAALATSIT